jgi:hypothetical protein
MAISYPNLQATARRLIGENGTCCKLKNPVGETQYDPALNDYVQDYEIFDGFCLISAYDERLADGTVIRVGDRKVTAVLSGEPKPGLSKLDVYDKTGRILKETYQVINSAPVSPDASTVIIYMLHCRK